MTSTGRLFLAGGVAMGLALAAFVIVQARARTEPLPPRPEKPALRVRTVTPRVVPGGPGLDAREVRATGTLLANQRVSLAFPVPGVVDRIHADEGDRVLKGQAIARLDVVPYEAELQRAQARLRYLTDQLERVRLLHEQDLASEEELDAAQAEMSAAEAQRRLAGWRAERTVLHAPFTGRIAARDIEIGEVVDTDVTAFTLLAVDTLKAKVGIPAKDSRLLTEGGPVVVRSVDRPEILAQGWIDHLPVSGDPRSGTLPVLVKLVNREGVLLPGLLVECEFPSPKETAPTSRPELRIPVSAIRLTQDGPVVIRLDGDRAEVVAVQTGTVRGEEVVVLSGVKPRDVLVNDAPDRLRPGDRVVPTPMEG